MIDEMREKVARSIRDAACETEFECADAAIAAVLECLIEMDIPEEALRAADEATVWYNNGLAGLYEPEFRSILTALKPLLTQGSQL